MNNNESYFINKYPWIKENNLPIKVPGYDNYKLIINNSIIEISKNKPLYLPLKFGFKIIN
jgi:hypothetical protein